MIGFEYASWHPVPIGVKGNLLILSNIFGKCLAGSHNRIVDENMQKGIIHVGVNHISLAEFFSIESMGVECNPRCGGCKCGRCAPGEKGTTLKEERELAIIENNLVFVEDHFEVKYPWIKDPNFLSNNYRIG